MAALASSSQYGRATLFTWALTEADTTGDAGTNPGAPDRSLQVAGEFGGATLIIEGTNDPARVEWATMHDPTGAALAVTSAGLFQLLENTLFLRPRLVDASPTTALMVRILSRSL